MSNKFVQSFILFSAIAVSAASYSFGTNPANAGPRYGTPPPVVMSADLTAPWVMQLRSPTARSNSAGFNPRQRSIPPLQMVARQSNSSGFFSPRRQTGPQPSKQPPSIQMDPKYQPQLVSYSSNKAPGTIFIDTNDKFLYLILGNGQARRYGVGVGKAGFEWTGTNKISRKAQWPDWRPPSQMIAREKEKGRILPAFVEGGPHNPLGARALYLGDTLYRIHGTNSPWTIGQAVSSGCIRMRNEDVMDLYERVKVGSTVVVS